LRLSKRTEYGLCAIIRLAQAWPGGYVQTRDLAEEEGLPAKFLESILLALRRGGFLESKVGSGGGYRLAQSPAQIVLGDVLRRLEGRLTVRDRSVPTDASPGKMAVYVLNRKLTEATDQVLAQLTLEQLIEELSRAGGGDAMYYI
jgi:Rrf2 family cysteine metabolism transcriptional repressor